MPAPEDLYFCIKNEPTILKIIDTFTKSKVVKKEMISDFQKNKISDMIWAT